MEYSKVSRGRAFSVSLLLLLLTLEIQSASVKDIFNLNAAEVTRLPRETQYYGSRYGSSLSSTQSTSSSRPIKPEDAPEARERDGSNVEKRCIRCDYYNRDYRYPSDYRGRYDERYDDRGYKDRNDDRGYRDRNDDRGYRDRFYDDYDRRNYDTDRRYYSDSDRRYYDTDRRYDDRDRYDRFDRERYDRKPDYDRYDRDRYDRDDRNRNYDRNGYRPWDETTRGSSGFDSSGRGYYFAVGRPDYSNYGGGYASSWNYGGGRDYNKDRGWREQGTTSSKPIRTTPSNPDSFSSGPYRPRDPYDPGYNRGTSYLYGRPSSTTTTQSPSSSGGSTVTTDPQTQVNTSSG